MDELVRTTSMTSLAAKVNSAFALINEKKKIEKTGISIEELRIIIGRVIALCGIKETPSQEIASTCLRMFEEKFAISMNKHELALAFDLNIRGDLEKKVEHYQCFSVEYFCEVLNEYRKKKIQAKAHEEKKEEEKIAPTDVSKEILQNIVDDYVSHHTKEKSEIKFPISFRLEMLSKMFDVDTSVENIEKLRAIAANNVWQCLAKEKHKSESLKKFGQVVSFQHQIARIKSQKLITNDDENMIQVEVSHLLYRQVFDTYKPNKEIQKSTFITHIKNHI